MTNWPPGLNPDDIAYIDLVGFTLGGIRGGVERAMLEVRMRDGTIVPHEFDAGDVAHGTLSADIERFNRSRRRDP